MAASGGAEDSGTGAVPSPEIVPGPEVVPSPEAVPSPDVVPSPDIVQSPDAVQAIVSTPETDGVLAVVPRGRAAARPGGARRQSAVMRDDFFYAQLRRAKEKERTEEEERAAREAFEKAERERLTAIAERAAYDMRLAEEELERARRWAPSIFRKPIEPKLNGKSVADVLLGQPKGEASSPPQGARKPWSPLGKGRK